MLDLDTRMAILRLHREGHGLRKIARALRISRNTVTRVLGSGQPDVPKLQRPDQLSPYLNLIRTLNKDCEGNLVRVVEELEPELAKDNVSVCYSTLTAFCRRHEIGTKPKKPVGRYHFKPGHEMQHDTSPHTVKVGGKRMKLQCASLVLCYSRMLFAQCFGRWSRFECRAFLSMAFEYFGGAAGQCMVDNSSVVRAHGTGKNMVPAPAMVALGKRFGFHFVAHELGDKDRSARVERNFHYIENNAYPGRTFDSITDLNRQLRDWCDKVNRAPRRLRGEVKAVPMELFASERSALRPLPLHLPEIYDLHSRRVDTEGYITLHRNRYSAPVDRIGRRLEVRESLEQVRLFDGHELIATHDRIESGTCRRSTLPEHRGRGRWKKKPGSPTPQEKALCAAGPEMVELVGRLRKRHGGQASRVIKALHRLYLDYPTSYLVDAVRTALHFGLLDLGRIERMALQRIRGDFFRLPPTEPGADPEK